MFSVTWFIILPDDDDVNPQRVGEIEVIMLCPPCVHMLGLTLNLLAPTTVGARINP